jgi:uncharacterized protein
VREDTIVALSVTTKMLYKYFRPSRVREAQRDAKHIWHAGRKIGRNDACGCGSGKKYKHCCGSSGAVN